MGYLECLYENIFASLCVCIENCGILGFPYKRNLECHLIFLRYFKPKLEAKKKLEKIIKIVYILVLIYHNVVDFSLVTPRETPSDAQVFIDKHKDALSNTLSNAQSRFKMPTVMLQNYSYKRLRHPAFGRLLATP